MIYVFLADGFEEIEALTPVDFLRRAGFTVKTVSVDGMSAVGAHNIKVEADIGIDDVSLDSVLEAVILPGGMPGAKNLDESRAVQECIDYAYNNGKLLCAICAAPFILGKKGILKGKNATCFPGFESELKGAFVKEDGVVRDGNIITAKGAGVAWEFSAEIASVLSKSEKAADILRGIQWKR